MAYSIKEIEEDVKLKFAGKNRLNHILGVRDMALHLGSSLGLDLEKLEIAALLHDYTKYDSLEEQIKEINDPVIVERFKDATAIYHAYAAANVAREKFQIEDPIILNAIRYHVYGRIHMNKYEKVLVLADYTEINRQYDSCIRVRNMIDKYPFDLVMYECEKEMIQALDKIGIQPSEEQYAILKELEEIKNGIIKNN